MDAARQPAGRWPRGLVALAAPTTPYSDFLNRCPRFARQVTAHEPNPSRAVTDPTGAPARPAGRLPGLYSFDRAIDQQRTVRYHLRVDAGGGGLLVVNAIACARLTASGVLIARGGRREARTRTWLSRSWPSASTTDRPRNSART